MGARYRLGHALLNVATTAWAFDRAPFVRRARVMGMFSTSIWIGFGVGPQVAEALREAWGFDAVWVWCAATALAAGLIARLMPPQERHASAHDPSLPRSGRERIAAALEGPRAAAVPGAIAALVARVPAGDLVDRCGSHGPAIGALLLVAAGWVLMSAASSFGAAAAAS